MFGPSGSESIHGKGFENVEYYFVLDPNRAGRSPIKRWEKRSPRILARVDGLAT